MTDLRSFLKFSCHKRFRFAEREVQCILGECGPLNNNLCASKVASNMHFSYLKINIYSLIESIL